ncbi:hypothetical protein TNCV_2236051 [Trichonephila clavipes]|nr:hypothetical protein TNCV_2236051 [Trichonephila clavipes]
MCPHSLISTVKYETSELDYLWFLGILGLITIMKGQVKAQTCFNVLPNQGASNFAEGMGICKCNVPVQQGGTLNIHRTVSHFESAIPSDPSNKSFRIRKQYFTEQIAQNPDTSKQESFQERIPTSLTSDKCYESRLTNAGLKSTFFAKLPLPITFFCLQLLSDPFLIREQKGMGTIDPPFGAAESNFPPLHWDS